MNNATQKTTIEFLNKQILVRETLDSGIENITETNLQTLVELFARDHLNETPFLPSQWGVVKYYKKGDYEGIVLTTPPSNRSVSFTGNTGPCPKKISLTVPPLLWVFEILSTPNKKSLTHSMVYALKHELLSLNDRVYVAPFPNIGIEHGICWGSGNQPELFTMRSLQHIPARFFQQPFNADLSTGRTESFRSPVTKAASNSGLDHMFYVHQLAEEAAERGEDFLYPFHTLKPDPQETAQRAIERYLSNIL